MRTIELTIAIGSALGLLTMIVADAAQQRMAATALTPANAVGEFGTTPASQPAHCVPTANAACTTDLAADDGSLG